MLSDKGDREGKEQSSTLKAGKQTSVHNQGYQAQVPHYSDHVETQKQEEEGDLEFWLIC